jgi:LmbE family N-acetylglucosaminyl deacetylase
MKRHPIVTFVFAHPDDESFATGGTILKLANEGAFVDLLCATRGEAGSTGNPPICTREELPSTREGELREACKRLGVNQLTLLDYIDKTLDQSDQEELISHIRSHLAKVQPDVIITFHPNGISGHRDHTAIQRATLQAVQSKFDHPTRLYYVVIPDSQAKLRSRSVQSIPDDQITTAVDVSLYKKQLAHALRAHQTQHQSIQSVFPGVWEGTSLDALPNQQFYQLAWGKYEKARTFWL